jgi:hypothetical protein
MTAKNAKKLWMLIDTTVVCYLYTAGLSLSAVNL